MTSATCLVMSGSGLVGFCAFFATSLPHLVNKSVTFCAHAVSFTLHLHISVVKPLSCRRKHALSPPSHVAGTNGRSGGFGSGFVLTGTTLDTGGGGAGFDPPHAP